MRRVLVCLISISLALILFGSPFVLKSKAGENDEGKVALTQSASEIPGSRCTRLMYGPKAKEKPAPGSRCPRLSWGPRKGKVLPNTPPKIGLSASVRYVTLNAQPQVNLKSIACDAEDETLLYTYSTTGGRIEGNGSEAMWNLSEVQPGNYTVSVEVDDGCGCISFANAQVTVGSAR